MSDSIKSHIPGSLEYLEEDEDGFSPLDVVLYWIGRGFERCEFKYEGNTYILHCDAWDKDRREYYIAVNKTYDEILYKSRSIAKVLDAPCLPGGVTARQALASCSFDDFYNI